MLDFAEDHVCIPCTQYALDPIVTFARSNQRLSLAQALSITTCAKWKVTEL